jgi:hypothetical protein
MFVVISWFRYLHLQVFIVYPFPRLLFLSVEILLKDNARGTGSSRHCIYYIRSGRNSLVTFLGFQNLKRQFFIVEGSFDFRRSAWP